jgi:hypothetical protein
VSPVRNVLEWSTQAIAHPALDGDANSACDRQSPLGSIDPQHLPRLIVHLDPGELSGSPALTRPAPSRLIAVATCRVTVSRCQICHDEEAEEARHGGMALHSPDLECLPGRRIDFDADCLVRRPMIGPWTFRSPSMLLAATSVASDAELLLAPLSSELICRRTRSLGGALGLGVALELAHKFG